MPLKGVAQGAMTASQHVPTTVPSPTSHAPAPSLNESVESEYLLMSLLGVSAKACGWFLHVFQGHSACPVSQRKVSASTN